jgi:hypothetical protein
MRIALYSLPFTSVLHVLLRAAEFVWWLICFITFLFPSGALCWIGFVFVTFSGSILFIYY